ncbi:MAG: extracellular solute-binding protein [Pseudomonadota bacterium]
MSAGMIDRRQFLAMGGAGIAWAASRQFSLAANPVEARLHGLSSFGELKYGPDYTQFDYAVPDAPQGGTFAFSPPNWLFNQNPQTFNTLNSYVLSGEAPPRMELCFDKLMVHAWDEPDAIYCSLAESVMLSEDRNSFEFKLRPQAKFVDGSPVTAADVVFSALLLKEQGHPRLALGLINLDDAVEIDEHTMRLDFNGKQSDRAILSITQDMPILSKAYYSKNDFTRSTLEPPLSSGPWQVGRFEVGRFVEYDRNRDYWGQDMPFQRGLDHFDKIRIDFFQDRQAAFEAFKKGLVRWREEFTSKVWATEYNFPSIKDGRVKKELFETEKFPSLQGWAVNTRRKKFSDPATRKAVATLFDFEWTNRNLFYDAYDRSHSLFENTELAAFGKPGAGEMELLEPLRGQLTEDIFGEAVQQNTTNGTGRDRRIFRMADALFKQAGWQKKDGKLVDANGEQLSIEVLIRSPVFERLLGPYTDNMRAMGIDPSIRLVDPSQFQSRIEAFDFDMVGMAFSFEANPTGEALRRYFHSSSADVEGSFNYPGIADPAIDALVERIGKSKNREELIVTMRALDRVLRAGHYWIPNWHSKTHRVAMWDMFGWKDPKPDYFFPVERLWWWDSSKPGNSG